MAGFSFILRTTLSKKSRAAGLDPSGFGAPAYVRLFLITFVPWHSMISSSGWVSIATS